ncbi:MAG: 50S ribosomal protein L28 [Candidatus Omnitrophica bacterium]|nr:50S ribosomal protein L28 [Candidatus Omnitrophota bacterium]
MKCKICGKGPKTGNNVSHSNVKTRRTWKPNVQKLLVEYQGKISKLAICTQCLKSGKVKRPQRISEQSFTSSQMT